MLPKRTDSKGRVTLGPKFANKTVIVTEVDADEMCIKLATFVPSNEAWLHKNREAKACVFRGLAQLKAGEVSEGPDLEAGEHLVQQIKDADVHRPLDAGGH